MFKKPVGDWKTSAPLRTSDRRKLRTKILSTFSIYDPTLGETDADELVPDPVLSVKFATHLNIPGVAYLDKNGEPRWFTVGKGSEDVIPTVYTLWKRPNLLPFLSTPAAVIPKISDGADLMIPGVVEYPDQLAAGTLVSVTQFHGAGTRGPPLAVGHLAVPAEEVAKDDAKGKAVIIVHAWKDHLWDRGSKCDVPEPVQVAPNQEFNDAVGEGAPDITSPTEEILDAFLGEETQPTPNDAQRSPEDVTGILQTALLQAITTSLSSLPPSSFPMPATTLYTQHILPCRPSFVLDSVTPVDIKHSTHKSLTTFLRAADKEGILKLKSAPKSSEVLVASVNATHPLVASHKSYTTAADVDAKRERKERREKTEQEALEKASKEIAVRELWKPHGVSIPWFSAECGHSTKLFTSQDLKTLLNEHITQRDAINKQDGRYLNVSMLDDFLVSLVSGGKPDAPQEGRPSIILGAAGEVEFATREVLLSCLQKSMQPHYEITYGSDGESITKKGTLSPISIATKVRQGRKSCTLITDFEPFGIQSEELAEELRKTCASATSVTPLPGKSAGMEVLVQGDHRALVQSWFVDHGVPSQWVHTSGLKGDKNKKK